MSIYFGAQIPTLISLTDACPPKTNKKRSELKLGLLCATVKDTTLHRNPRVQSFCQFGCLKAILFVYF